VTTNTNYWSPLSCPVDKQNEDDDNRESNQQILSIIATPKSKNKIAEKWKQRKENRAGILDIGCTSGAGAEKDVKNFHDTGLRSEKTFMLPDKTKIKATKTMQLKHNLQAGAGKINIVPNLHSTLISVPKMADYSYIAVFDKTEARIYDGTTTTITALGEPIIVAPRCNDTGLWKMELNLNYEVLGTACPAQFIAGADKANAIFDLPNNRQTLQYLHASTGFPVKETFLAAVRARNYATWPELMTTLIAKHFPDSDEMQKGHMKGQRKGVQSTKVKPPVHIKIEPTTETAPNLSITKENDIFVVIYELSNTVHTDQTGAFSLTSQQGYCYIMVGIHLDANYIFCELMKNRTEDEMITAYQRMVDRMVISGLGLKHHRLDNECSKNLNNASEKME
jgi:hypothetical protein